jgi:hypothetical protein
VRLRLPALLLAAALGLSACSQTGSDASAGASPKPPRAGSCRMLAPSDILRPTNAAPTVACSAPHTAQTFLVSTFRGDAARPKPDDVALGAQAFKACQKGFIRFLGADESLAMRSTLTWAWFRPSDAAWKQGARWLRCDVVGGGEQSKSFVRLPASAKGLLLGKPDDRWMVCVDGPTVAGSVKIPCAQEHTWRAVTTISLGRPGDPYPGDRVVQSRTRDYCSQSVGAWLSYPADYDFGYTYFHRGEWRAGNRRSICWAKTDR